MNFRKFTLKHVTLVTLAPALVVWGVITALTYSDIRYAGYSGIAAMAVMFLTSFALRKYHASFMKKAEDKLYKECDPFPMAEELDLYLECANRRVDKTGMKIMRAMMLAFAGEYASSEDILRSVEIGDQRADLIISVQYNLATLYCLMNLRQNAVECYDRAMAEASKLPDYAKERMKFDKMTEAEVECYKGNCERAEKIAEQIDESTRLRTVMRKYTLAKIHYISGAKSKAVEEFEWVAQNGGRLACAAESAEIAKVARERAAASAAE